MVTPDITKLKELILYIAEKCQFRLNFGATMLNKILFFSDFIAYAQNGKSVTDAEYFKLGWGPAPKHLLSAREELESDGLIVIQKISTMKGDQERVVPTGKRVANIDEMFSPRQISLVDSIIESVKNEDAKSVSGLSHKFYGWQITKHKETIPYQTVFLREPVKRPTPNSIKQRIEQLNSDRQT